MTGTATATPRPSAVEAAQSYAREHLEVIALAVLLLATQLLPKSIPLGIYAATVGVPILIEELAQSNGSAE